MAQQWLVTGAGGMLGRDLVDVLVAQGICVTAATKSDLDITDLVATRRAVSDHDMVVNAAAWTKVDDAETYESAALRVNGTGTANLATACAESDVPLIHMSTDYVLPGDADTPYSENTQPDPINAYGRSKLAGESEVLRISPKAGYVVRTSWMYGRHGSCFVKTILRLSTDHEYIDVVNDQRGQPTWSYTLAQQLSKLGEAILQSAVPPGIYHCASSGDTTWYEFARHIFAEAGLDPRRIRPTSSARYRRPARRPAYSVLGHDRWEAAGLPLMPSWQDMLTTALPGIKDLL